MPQDIKFLLVFLIIVLAVLIYLQNQQCSAIPNDGKLTKRDNFLSESDMTDDMDMRSRRRMLTNNEEEQYRIKSMNNNMNNNMNYNMNNNMNNNIRDNNIRDNLVDNILRNTQMESVDQELDSLIDNESISQESVNSSGTFNNPIDENINKLRDNISSSGVANDVLEELIKEVNTGNDLQINSAQNKIFQNRSRSINSAKNYRKISYADSDYRYNFNGDENNSHQDPNPRI